MDVMRRIVFFLAIIQASSHIKRCPKRCVCNETKHAMSCHGAVLTYIPRAPSFVTKYELSGASIGLLTKEHMMNLTHCVLTHLILKKNNITGIGTDAFVDLRYLQKLFWEQDFFPLSDFELLLEHVSSKISDISISALILDKHVASASSFRSLVNLQALKINMHQLKFFNATGLSQLVNLTSLDLSTNRLSSFSLTENLPKLKHLNLGQNDLTEIPQLCLNMSVPTIPRLSILILQDNAIRILETRGISCLKNMKKLVLSQNRIETLNDNVFATLAQLTELQLSRLTSLQYVEHLAFNSTSLSKILFTENPKMTNRKFKPASLFSETPNLATLDLTNTKLDISVNELKALLLTLKNVKHLTMQRTFIKELPTGVFSKLSKLENVSFSGNMLTGWSKDVFANVTNIKHIFFDGCNIKTINESSLPLEFRLSIKEIDLANNPFVCTCDLLWFKTWLDKVRSNRSITFSQYPHRYNCRAPNINALSLEDFHPTEKSCTITKLYTLILTVVLTVSLTITVTVLVVYRYRWHLLYWISLFRRRRQTKSGTEEKRFDAFVSYSESDGDWVYDELLDFLERELGLSLCEHSRDFQVGTFIVDNVMGALDSSRKTILVISNEYMKSDWCQFELQMALYSFLKHETDIVVILLHPIKVDFVTSSLRALMMSTTMMPWCNDTEAKALFKERLRNILCDGDTIGSRDLADPNRHSDPEDHVILVQ
ncbi:toll-like receptor 13 [Haliotis asinina]|uniref:toll-like receptor 13 n=1 Tax=Haliotis asinina TaxID=109174 RepID=UPI0035322A38